MADRTAIFYYVARVDDAGKAEPVDLTQRVKSFTYYDRERGMDKLTLTIDNFDLSNFDNPMFEYGGRLRVAWGTGQSTAPIRDMVVRKVTGGRELTVTAVTKDGAKMDTVKRRRVFDGMKRSEVVEAIARENGFSTTSILIDETQETFPVISQGNLTDGELMRKLASLEGFEFFIDHTGLNWKRRRVEQAPIRSFIYYVDPAGGEILDFNVENDVTRRPGKVTVKSRDPLTKQDITAEVTNSSYTDRQVLATESAVIDGETGELVRRKEVSYETTSTGAAPQTQADAEVQAKAAYRQATQGAVKLTLTLRGDPSFVAKSVVEVSGLGKRVSGKYYVREVTHTLDASGGYAMVAKLITDGFQGGKGGSAGGGQGETAGLPSLADRLVEIAASEVTAAIDGETGDVLQGNVGRQTMVLKSASGIADATRTLSGQSGDEQVRNAATLSTYLKKFISAARQASMPGTASAAQEILVIVAKIAERITAPGNAGVVNKKTLNDAETRPVKTIDTDGREVTRYQRTGGRE